MMSLRVDEIDLFSPETQEDWYPAYNALLEGAPVYHVPGTNMWMITKYEDIQWIVKQPARFPSGHTRDGALLKDEEANRVYEERGWRRWTPLGTNPPDHRKYRALVDPFFSGSGADRYRDLITKTINDLVDEWIGNGEVEFVGEFAMPLPVRVITQILGFPVEDIPQLRVWSNAWVMPFSLGLTREQELYVAEKGVEFQQYIHGHIEAKRRSPQNDVISFLANEARFDDRPLTDSEIISIVDHLYIGGNETTTFALTSGLWLLGRYPEQWAKVKADRSKIRNLVEEVLRMESPTQGLFRLTSQDEEIRGVKIPAGASLHLRFAAANRDPEMFRDPERFDVDRENASRHVAFSQGEHHCPGSGLTRVEQNIAWGVLFDRIERFVFTPGKNDFTHLPGFVLRAMKELHISFERA